MVTVTGPPWSAFCQFGSSCPYIVDVIAATTNRPIPSMAALVGED